MSASKPSPLKKPAAHKRRFIADSLRQMVADLQAGDRLPSVTDLEKHFGVAKSTVEAAVSDLQTEGLIVRRQGAGTFVAPPLATRLPELAGRMAITCIPLGEPMTIFSAMAAALESEMRRLGYDPILQFDMNAQARLTRVQERWEERGIDGYVHVGSVEKDVVFPAVPGVVVGELPEGAPVHQVVVDNYGGGRRMGEHLWELGHRRVAFVTNPALTPAAHRFEGLRDVYKERGGMDEEITFAPLYRKRTVTSGIPGTSVFENTLEETLKELLNKPDSPTAIFFANDQVALPALSMLLSWGCRIPEDLSVTSFDDTPGLTSHTRPALTGLRMPTLALGSLAVQTLHQAIREPGSPFRRTLLPAELILRESSGPVRDH
jgi:DNA-binding LacI/PurR family transcriptional regulator